MAANDGGTEMAAVGAAVIDLAAAMAPTGAEEVTLRHKGGGTIGVTIRYDLRPDYDYPTAEVGEGPLPLRDEGECRLPSGDVCQCPEYQASLALLGRRAFVAAGSMASAGVAH